MLKKKVEPQQDIQEPLVKTPCRLMKPKICSIWLPSDINTFTLEVLLFARFASIRVVIHICNASPQSVSMSHSEVSKCNTFPGQLASFLKRVT